ncbi:MAG: hydroxymethylbilane synthase [Desulfobacterales bacterium]|nr:hydroxymethylbilane synthase [Desulfobacterales bacterium]MCP4159956.1 hydroxymethylbilane synthase [Deltaproteobacteria bacterium]
MDNTIRIGTRGSSLALWQANWVKDTILENFPEMTVELEIIKTKGDKILDVPLAKVGGKGLFVKEIEEALLSGRIDIAIHSMKDMPAELPEGLTIGAIPDRENPSDVVISKDGLKLSELPEGATVGTSSLRRSSQLYKKRPDFKIVALRGNIDTRIKKLKNGEMDAIILAAAGVHRLGFSEVITEYIDHDTMLPAVGQGALCVETRLNDDKVAPILDKMNHHDTRVAVLCERAFLNRLEGSCQIPVAAHATIEDGKVTLKGLVCDLDGKERVEDFISAPEDACESAGTELANRLLEKGADEILKKVIADAE